MIFKKLATMRQGIKERGFIDFFRYFLFESDNVFLGRLVELMGNRVRIEGLVIYTDSRVIPVINKSQFIQDRFEKPERNSIKQFLDPAMPVIELGGSLGVVACMTNRRLQDPKQHIVVEAHPEMARLLRKNKARNKCQFQIVNKAIAYGTDTVRFYERGFSSGVETQSGDSIEVSTTTLETILQKFRFTEFTLICDIEGAEIDLLQHESDIFQRHIRCIIIELHPETVGEEKNVWFIRRLHDLGFEQLYQEKKVYVFNRVAG